MILFWVIAALVFGFGAGWVVARSRRTGAAAGGVRPVLPSPAVRWLREAYGGLGVWAVSRGDDAEEVLPERVVDDRRLSREQEEMVLGRMRLAARGGSAIIERLEAGVLVADVAGARVAGVLLPAATTAERLDLCRVDLRHLLEALAYRSVAQAWAQDREVVAESPGTVGLALAFELERMLNAETLVATADGTGVRVIGTSLRSDRC